MLSETPTQPKDDGAWWGALISATILVIIAFCAENPTKM